MFDLGLGGASDADIADHAETAAAILVSKDEDFLLRRLPDRFVFLWLRCGNTTTSALIGWLDHRWPRVDELLAAGEKLIELR